MDIMCTDNRFEIIGKAKEDLLEATNIDTSPDEMKVLDNFLFRCWQMGWLDRYEDKECFMCIHFGDLQVCGRCRHRNMFCKTEWTSGVIWTEEAIQNEPAHYTTWASTKPQCEECEHYGHSIKRCLLNKCKYVNTTDCSWK